jgi:protein transport protein SEC23
MSAAEDLKQMAYGFDQETSAVLMARMAVNMTLTQEALDVIRYMDRLLIKLVNRFAEYKKDDASTFRLSREFGLFP